MLRIAIRASSKGRRTRESEPESLATASSPVPVKRKRAAVRSSKSSGSLNIASPRQSVKSADPEEVAIMLNVRVTLSEPWELNLHAMGEDTSIQNLLHEAVVGLLGRRSPLPPRPPRTRG
ncbi:MAG: hypothetical protein HQ453_07845 [Actinobacteria bacterium]|nr:hypothetical protein [Actinomycetota bacterium]